MLNLQGSSIAFVNDKLQPSQEDGRAGGLLPSRGKRILQHSQDQGIETGSRTLEIGEAVGGHISDRLRLKEDAERWKKLCRISRPRADSTKAGEGPLAPRLIRDDSFEDSTLDGPSKGTYEELGMLGSVQCACGSAADDVYDGDRRTSS